MKKYIITISSLLSMIFVLAGCEKELMDYEGKDCLYFDVRRGPAHIHSSLWAHQYFSDVSFGTMVEDQHELSLTVMSSGTMKDYDRKFKVVVVADSTTAVNGSDYTGLQNEYVIKAGETSTQIRLQVNRTVPMDGDTICLQLKLIPGEHFDLRYDWYIEPGPYQPINNIAFACNRDASIHNLYFYDVLSMPRGEDGLTTSGGWYGQDVGGSGIGLFGNFSPKKFRLMMELTNTTVADYANKKIMPAARAQSISETLAKYLLKMAESRETVVLDEDGTMMHVMTLSQIDPSRAWAAFTKPEDYFK